MNEYKKGDDVSKADKTIVADHKDLKDEGQTVKVSKEAKRVPPKTGDDTPLKLWLALMFAAIAAILPLAIKETIERRRQHKEDMEMFG